MGGAPKPANEDSRLALLRQLEVLDTEPEPMFDQLTKLASELFDTPIALVSLVDAERQWFKSRVGLGATETPREHAFCAWAIREPDVLVVSDATADPRFAENPLVLDDPNIRFYAGAPLKTDEGSLGTLCVIDRAPRDLTTAQRATLERLASVVTEALLLRRQSLISERRARLLNAAEELAGVGHWRLDRRNGVLYWSDQVYRIHGVDPESFTPSLETGIDAYHPEDRARVAAHVQKTVDGKGPFEFEARIVQPDGTVRQVRSQGVAEVSGSAVISVFGVFQDITERSELRARLAQAEKMASIGTLAAGVAHEVNNPLNYVKVNAITLAEEIADWIGSSPSSRLRELAELVDEIRDGALRIERIVGGLKAFSRRSEGLPEAVELERVFRLAERLCANELRHTAKFSITVDSPATVLADETQLVQVAVNLMVNACHAMEGQTGEGNEVRVQIGRSEDDAFFVVTDNGSGMTDEVLRQAFTPFYTTKMPGVGTGLGLAICHGIVTSLGGTIVIDTKLGRGTAIRCALPAYTDPLGSNVAPRTSAPPARRLRLMIVDDEPLVAKSIGRVFRAHEVEIHQDPHEALDVLREGPSPDVILCDVMMPSMSGARFHEALQEMRPELAERLVMITGGVFSDEGRAFVESGVPVVAKPIDVDELRGRVAGIVGDSDV